MALWVSEDLQYIQLYLLHCCVTVPWCTVIYWKDIVKILSYESQMCLWWDNSNAVQRKSDSSSIWALLLQSRKNGIRRGTSNIFTASLLNNILIFNIFKFLVLVTFTMEYTSNKYFLNILGSLKESVVKLFL